MTKDEALKLALEALEEAWYHVGTFQPTEKAIDLYDEARTAIKEALAQPERSMKLEGPLHVVCQCDKCKAQPEQEINKDGSPCPEFWDWLPKAYNFEGNGNFTKYNMEVAFLAGKQASQPEQEPVACKECRLKDTVYDLLGDLKVANLKLSVRAKRTLIGLTDEEREQVINANTSTGLWHMAKDIEAKLKEKNT